MQKFSRLMTVAGLTALIGAVQPVWAESAPVFDVDSMDEQSQDLPMPPPPGEEAQVLTRQSQSSQAQQPATTFVPVENSPVSDQLKPQQTAQLPAQPADTKPVPAPVVAGAERKVDAEPQPSPAGVSVSTANLTAEQRMRRLEQQLSNLQNSGNSSQVESLQAEIQSLRGQVEQLNHELNKVQAERKAVIETGKKVADASVESDVDTEVDTDAIPAGVSKKVSAKKVRTVPGVKAASEPMAAAASTSSSTSTSTIKDQPDVAEEQKVYQTAYDQIKAKKYPEAVETLQTMLKKYPGGQFASNAHYWLGELYGLLGKNDEALNEFSTVINKFPGSPRVSDAELKVGLILAAQSKWNEAKKTFKKIINTYPGTASSRLASEQLKQIKVAGH